MQKNVGGYDRIVRLVLGLLLVVVGVAGYAGLLALAVGPIPQALGSVIAFLVGAILLVTGYTETCLLYLPFGFSTRRADAESAPADGERGAERPS
ncbi:MAG: DUF2892 domain-containing protein [Salinigranum sp.]